jgi:hypothetical protein
MYHCVCVFRGQVFALNNALCAWLLASTAVFFVNAERGHQGANGGRRWMGLKRGAVLCGLCLSNQHTSLLLVAPAVTVVLLCIADEIKRQQLAQGRARSASPFAVAAALFRVVLVAAGCVLLGLAPYLYLPWAASRGRARAPASLAASWGGADLATPTGFLRWSPPRCPSLPLPATPPSLPPSLPLLLSWRAAQCHLVDDIVACCGLLRLVAIGYEVLLLLRVYAQ